MPLAEVPREDHMAEYDLVIRNTTIATAADVVKGDIGISPARLGQRLERGWPAIAVGRHSLSLDRVSLDAGEDAGRGRLWRTTWPSMIW